MSILSQRRSRKVSPIRSVSPACFHPGILLKIGSSDGSISRDDLAAFELPLKSKKYRDYGFQVAPETEPPMSPPPSDLPSYSSPDYSPSNSIQENKKQAKRFNQNNSERCCASCGATKTPYWRDAWGESISLCNACGLRYAKFKKRCSSCLYVPRKEDKTSRACTQCRGSWV